MNYEYLKPFFEGGPLSFEQLTEKLDAADGVKLANLKDGGYVGRTKFDALEARASGLQAQLSEANGKLEGYGRVEGQGPADAAGGQPEGRGRPV